jgi:hypothetical protein
VAIPINVDGDPIGGSTAIDNMNEFNNLDINCTHMIVNGNGEVRMEDILLLLFFMKYVLLEFTLILILLPSSLIGSYRKVTPKDGHLVWKAKSYSTPKDTQTVAMLIFTLAAPSSSWVPNMTCFYVDW